MLGIRVAGSAWNCGVAQFFTHYCWHRLREGHMGTRFSKGAWPKAITMLCIAMWHGLEPGYYFYSWLATGIEAIQKVIWAYCYRAFGRPKRGSVRQIAQRWLNRICYLLIGVDFGSHF